MITIVRGSASVFLLVLAACGGSDDRTYSPPTQPPPGNGAGGLNSAHPLGPVPVTHNQLVNNFMSVLGKYQGDFTTLAKASTDQYNHFILKTYSHSEEMKLGTDCDFTGYCTDITTTKYHGVNYYAIDISGWELGKGLNANQFLENNLSIEAVKLLGKEADKVFQGLESGRIFTKGSNAPKNLAKIKALEETFTVLLRAEKLVERYGLSNEKALDVSKFSYRLRKAVPGTYQLSDFDAFSKELIGSSISEFQIDMKEQRLSSLNDRIKKAQALTGIGIEGLNHFINDVVLAK